MERENLPTLIDAALLVGMVEPTSEPRTTVTHRNTLGVAEGLHRKMGQLLDHLSESFIAQMKTTGIEIRMFQVAWAPKGNEQEAYEKLCRSRLVLELRPVQEG